MKRILLVLVLAAGCQKARPYDPRPGPNEEKAPPAVVDKPGEPKLPQNVDWDNPGRKPDEDQVPIVFVNRATRPEEWAALKAYWNEPPEPRKGEASQPVRIKVPLGLDDPTPYIPLHSTPTRARWMLGRRLFFDKSLLGAAKKSCADCHLPGEAFADGLKALTGFFNTPSLVNSVYNGAQFWDGRATYLEEVVQQKPEDERATADGPFRHAWPGVIGRLRASQPYRVDFDGAFGLAPNQTTVGQAIGTYLRTLLAGDSIHDRAELARLAAKAPKLEAAHYAAVLDAAALKRLGRPEGVPAVVAGDLARGHAAFHGAAGCARCHPSANGTYADNRFHNLGVDVDDLATVPAKLGRFAVAPLGEKNRYLRGAFRTPTLRGLLRTGPYFHNGQALTLMGAVRHHVYSPRADLPLNLFLDPLLADEFGAHRKFEAENDLDAIVLYLRALDGEEVDAFVRSPPAEAKKP